MTPSYKGGTKDENCHLVERLGIISYASRMDVVVLISILSPKFNIPYMSI